MIKILTRVAILAALSAPVGGCVTFNDAFPGGAGMSPESDEGPTVVLRPGFENRTGCPPGFHGIPFPNGNGFRCIVNGW